jgi:mono/diheme cytochrome c family protein
MKTFLLGFIAALVTLPIIVLGYFRLGLAATASDARPPAWESRLMRDTVHASVRRSASALQAPTPESLEDSMVEGGKLYFLSCMGCHGQPGKAGEDLSHYPRVPQLPQVGTQYSEPEIYWIVKHGIRMTAMSAYGPFYSEKQLWEIASFVRRINNLPPPVLDRIKAKKPPGASNGSVCDGTTRRSYRCGRIAGCPRARCFPDSRNSRNSA